MPKSQRPPFYTLINTSGSNIDPNYNESPLVTQGFQPNQVIPSKEHNTLWLGGGLWQVYYDYGLLQTDDALDASTSQRWTTNRLEYNVGSSVTGGGGAPVVGTAPVYFFGGFRLEIDDRLLKPAGACPLLVPFVATPGAIWIYVSTDALAIPTQPTAVARTEAVAAGDPASPGANEIALVRVDVDGAGNVAGNTYPGTDPAEEVVFGARFQRWTGSTFFDVTANFNAPSVAVLATSTITATVPAGLNAAIFSNVDPVFEAVTLVNTAGPALSTRANSAAAGNTLVNFGTGAVLGIAKTVAGSGITVDNTVGGGTCIDVTSPTVGVEANGETFGVRAQSTLGVPVQGTSLGSNDAIVGMGGPSAVSSGGLFTATHVDATGVAAFTAAGASTSAVAVQGTANADSTAVSGIAVNGYGVVAQSDTTSPTRAAVRWVPQDSDPSTPLTGDVHFGSDRGTGKLRVYTVQHESVHSSDKGWIKNFGLPAAGGPIGGGSGNLSLSQISPEETGDVLVTATGSLTFSTDTSFCNVELVDVTSALTIATSPERAMDTNGAGNRSRSFALRMVRTLPDTVTRTFAIVITVFAGTVTYANVISSTEGVQ